MKKKAGLFACCRAEPTLHTVYLYGGTVTLASVHHQLLFCSQEPVFLAPPVS